MFSCEICKNFKNIYFEEHLQMSASKGTLGALSDSIDKKHTKQKASHYHYHFQYHYHVSLSCEYLVTKIISIRGIIARSEVVQIRAKKLEFCQEPEHFHPLTKFVTIKSGTCYFLHTSYQWCMCWHGHM